MSRSESEPDITVRVQEWAGLADALRQAHLVDVDRVQGAVEAGLDRELGRRSSRFGAEAPATLEARARRRAVTMLRSEIRAEVGRIDTPAGRPQASAAVVHGRVVDSSLEAVPAVNVAALDETGVTLSADTTDRQGYFRLEVEPAEATGRRAKEADVEEADAPRVVLMVADAGGGVLHRDMEPSILPPGAVVFRDVVISERAPGDDDTKPRRVYHVTPRAAGGWSVQAEGATRATSTHATKDEAIVRGRELAKGHGLGQLIVHRKDGRIETEYRYGEDPRKTPD